MINKGVLYSSVEEAYQTLGFAESCLEIAEKIK